MTTEKAKALSLAIEQIGRQFGSGAVMRLGDEADLTETQSIPSGSLSLDLALGIGGIPKGRVTEIFGTESSGKSTLAYHIMAEAQNSGGSAAYIDAEHALDPRYAARCGVNTKELLISQPDTAEQGLEICEYLVRSGAIDIVVIDSVAALTPKSELEGDMGDSHVGLQARLMSQALRKLTSAISRSNTAVIFIIGSRVRARVVKNKVAPPFRVAEFDIMFNAGISKEGDLIDLGNSMGIVKKNGSFYSHNDTRLGQGRENAKTFLKDNKSIAELIENSIRKKEDTET